jgi:glutathione S-transferase
VSNAGVLTLYGNRNSGHSYKVALALNLLGLPWRHIAVDIGTPRAERPEPFRSFARYGEVPVLETPAGARVQSDAILCWLAETTGMLGGESADRMARVREWLFWEANRLGLSLPHLRYARRFAPQDYNPGVLQWLRTRYDADIARLADEFADGRAFVLGDAPTMADCALCGYLFWADEADVPVPAAVQGWLTRIRSLPGWRAPDDLLSDAERTP